MGVYEAQSSQHPTKMTMETTTEPRTRVRHCRNSADNSQPCWLCTYSTDPIATMVTSLISEHAHTMSLEVIATQTTSLISTELTKRCIKLEREKDGFSEKHVRLHISQHMLHPNVTLSLILRNLIELNETLRQKVYTVDVDNQETILDTAQLKNYIAIIGQIASIYKMGENNRLLFARGGVTQGTEARDQTKPRE